MFASPDRQNEALTALLLSVAQHTPEILDMIHVATVESRRTQRRVQSTIPGIIGAVVALIRAASKK